MGVGDSRGDKVRAKGGGDHGWDAEWRGIWSDQPVTSGLVCEFWPRRHEGVDYVQVVVVVVVAAGSGRGGTVELWRPLLGFKQPICL